MSKFIEVTPVYKSETATEGLAKQILIRVGHIDLVTETDNDDRRAGAKCVLIVPATSMIIGISQSIFVKESYSDIKRKIAWGVDAS